MSDWDDFIRSADVEPDIDEGGAEECILATPPKKKEPTNATKERKTKGFRLQYKTIGLTYSRCDLEPTTVRDKIHRLLNDRNMSTRLYYVCKESHRPTDPTTGKPFFRSQQRSKEYKAAFQKEVKEAKVCMFHIHAWFQLERKPNFRDPRVFDITGPDGTVYHPNIGNKKSNWVHNYLKKEATSDLWADEKEKNYVTNMEDGFVDVARSGDVEQALYLFSRRHAKDYVVHLPRIRENMRLLAAPKAQKPNIYPFTGSVPEWDQKKCLLVIGPSGCGKTEWAKSFCKHHLDSDYLWVTHIDVLKRYCGEKVLLFDDCYFDHLPRQTQIFLTDVDNPRDIHCRNTCAHIPAGVLRIFTANHYPFMDDPYGAIQRRVHRANILRFY